MSAIKTLPGVKSANALFFSFLLVALAIFGQAHATDKAPATLQGVSGYDGTGSNAADGPLMLGFSGVAPDGKYFVTASRVVAIFTSDPGISTATKHADSYDPKRSVWILKNLPAGSKLYAMGLGSDWAGNGPSIDGLDLSRSKASGEIKAGVATLGFERPATERCRVVNWVVVLPNGTRAWGPTAGDSSPWHVHIGGTKPANVWCFEGERVVAIGDSTRKLLATQK